MKKKDKDAFLKSVFGTAPIKKGNRVLKEIPISKDRFVTKSIINKTNVEIFKQAYKTEKKESLFSIEKGSINKKLKKGKIPIDRKIDFHGMSVLDAEEAFINTIINCYNKNLRCILFVTGKGIMKKDNNSFNNTKLYFGKIREGFLFWILKKELQKYILSVEQAGIENGADGAFFVYLRKKN